MNQRQVLWAIVFGAMLAVTGCGSDDGGTGGGSAGSGDGVPSTTATVEVAGGSVGWPGDGPASTA